MGDVNSQIGSLDRRINGLQGRIDSLQAAADTLQGVAYDLQVVVETPVQVYDAGPSWQGGKREGFESDKRQGKDGVDGLRRDVDAARGQVESAMWRLSGQQDDLARQRSGIIASSD